ncbi:1-phosphofructokinase family hexose kinase [Williamsoniiplasma luminosum]|uniref:Phosphofructokinase n=1 Tax=Williamsoniiplasma luminosum TaxID=214888 RepID=A0A2S0NJB5_9MOLU|nr:hexose kinase [Williamsoniiplasma luminosum]AVP49097.1 MAG: phosphofructokinase [Williamsoniiplasma luminosum]
MANNIYVISLSPAIDYILKFDELIKDKTNRPYFTEMYPAGKGIHVSMILNNLNVKNESIIFSNGDFENYFYTNLDKINIKYKKFKSEGDIRINLKLIDAQQTECSVQAPIIDQIEINKMKEYLKNNIQEGDYVIATGSVPSNMSNIYSEIVELTNSLKGHCVIDAFGESLNLCIDKKPFLIKPNLEELAFTTKMQISNEKELIQAAQSLLKKGAQNILVSRGSDGAIFINKNEILKCPIGNWNKQIINVAGAGDSMLGGFISEFIKTKNYSQSLKKSIICGSATAYSNQIASIKLINELTLTIEDLKIVNL